MRLAIGAAFMAVAVSAGYEPAPDFVIPDGATWLPPTKYCVDNPPIPYIPFTPEGEVPLPGPDSNGCEPAIVFCGLNPTSAQRVDWCSSSAGMPSGMGWSNNIEYAMTTNCALGARYSDCDLDNENGVDVGSVAVSTEAQAFTVSMNPGYAISSYSIQVGSRLNAAASSNFATYQTRGGSLADGASVSSTVPIQGADWFVMHAMVCPVDAGERNRTESIPIGAGGIAGTTLAPTKAPTPAPTRAPTLAPTPRPTYDRSPVANLWAGGQCDPHMALKSCPNEKFKMYFARTENQNTWKASAVESTGLCINKAGPTKIPPGFNGTITPINGNTFLTKTWYTNNTLKQQAWVFKWSYRHCYVIQAAVRDGQSNCLMTHHNNNVSELCEEFKFQTNTTNIQRGEIIFGCCDGNGTAVVTANVSDLRYADEGTQDSGNKTTKFGDANHIKACETYQYNNLTECTGPFCQATQSCSLRRGLQQLRFDSWPAVPAGEREEVIIQVMVIDTGEIFNFTHNTTGFPGKTVDGVTPDNFFVRPSFYVENRATFNALYNAQYRDGIAMQFYSTRRGPGGWNSCIFSPIGIDITRSGRVHMIEGNFSINIDGNKNTSTGFDDGDEYLNFWFGPQVGILVHDPPNREHGANATGEITGAHLIGDMGGEYADGYAKLATFDLDQDGEVSGTELEKFHLWVDANSNAHLDAGELKSLQQYNIVSLYTMHDCRKSRAVLADGTEILTEDLWFSRRR